MKRLLIASLVLVIFGVSGVSSHAEPLDLFNPNDVFFGDLHVHTTYSFDADLYSLRIFGDDGAHPPKDACNFARYCSKLDFFALTDHGESFTPDRWRKTKEAVRQCNAQFSHPGKAPDLLAFDGFEWTQVGDTPETHFGHQNIFFKSTRDDELPRHPVGALKGDEKVSPIERFLAGGLKLFRPFSGIFRLSDVLSMMGDLATQRECPKGVPEKQLPLNCRENVTNPGDLYKKLDQAGSDYIPVPHGTAWGTYTPPGGKIDNLLDYRSRFPLFEIYSGHGNSEYYREFHDGEKTCSPPTRDFLPCCWQAGEIMRKRCGGLSKDECERRVELARQLALEAGNDPYSVFPDAKPEEWLDCGQCRDCFKPVYNYRPQESAQYALAKSDFDHPDPSGRPRRFEFGFVGSSDNHSARPGTGYKQFAREYMTDVRGYENQFVAKHLEKLARGRQYDPQMPQPHHEAGRLISLLDVEWGSSFFYPGGLVGVHADTKSRDAIWQALRSRNVYATSGPKILLWTYLLNSPEGIVPMGAQVAQNENPHFLIRAQGSFIQKPGCPPDSMQALGAGGIRRLCRGECYNPTDRRHAIEAIEVIRIRPQRYKGEPLKPLIEDPWKRFVCPPNQGFCQIDFVDTDFHSAGRDTVYYVRALQEPTPAINGDNVRTRFDADGNAVGVDLCDAGAPTARNDDCMGFVEERAWSSPIFVHWK